MNPCCGIDLRKAVKGIAVLTAVYFGATLVIYSILLANGPELDEHGMPKDECLKTFHIAEQILGIVYCLVFIALCAVLYSGAVQSNLLRVEVWLGGMLVFCGILVQAFTYEVAKELTPALLINFVPLGVSIYFLVVVYSFAKQLGSPMSTCVM